MPWYGFLSAVRKAREDIERAKAEERGKILSTSVRSEIIAIFNALPEKRQAEMVAAVLSQSDLTDAMLRRFVQSCPQDKHVEIVFPHGATVVISGSAGEKRGPGW